MTGQHMLLREQVAAFYRARNGEPVWLREGGGWKTNPRPFVVALAQATREGLNPRHYPLAPWVAIASHGQESMEIDMAMTAIVMRYIHDVKLGRVEPEKVFPKFSLLPRDTDLVRPMNEALKHHYADPSAYFARLAPRHPDYKVLRKALAYYAARADEGNWQVIPAGNAIKPGMRDKRLPDVRARLWQLDMMKNGESASDTYDEETEAGIRRLQESRRIEVDGIIGGATLEQLNLSPRMRADRIRLAMERWRWLPHPLKGKYILVNTAGFYALAMDGSDTQLRMPVIVGETAHETPAFSSYITNVKFYPDWSVPSSIAKRYLLDKIRTNPEIVEALGYELRNEEGMVVPQSEIRIEQLPDEAFPPFRIRQKPGLKNALGLVRFSVENHYAIYLHDTPNNELFNETDRSLSSGCIRVREPAKLAQFLLEGNSKLSATEVAEKFAVKQGEQLRTKIIPLREKVPVHIVYMTAWVDEKNNVRFARDLYKRDAKLLEAMDRYD